MRHMLVLFIGVVGCVLGSNGSAAVGQGSGGSKLSLGEHVAVVDEIQFSYVVAGSGPLLIVQAPGWGIGSEYLRNGLAPLERHFTVVFYDTRGSGRSSRPADGTTITVSKMADDLEGLRQYWGLRTMTLLGHSWGGGIALAYSMRYPERVNKLILVDSSIPGFHGTEKTDEEEHKLWDAVRGDPRFADAVASFEAHRPVQTDEEFKADLIRKSPMFLYDPTNSLPKLIGTYPRSLSAWTWNAWITNFGKGKSNMATGGSMSAIQAPTLIIAGREDRICTVGMAELIHAGIQGSRLQVLEKTGHLPWIEAPHEFFHYVSDFIGGARSAAKGID
jgi:proline iminopeptidase